ncbi:MAG: hypothetical protein KF729_09475 [Sandaracinaceae bacterium]|nr:hypothetical protein [Sandaracinaceae bacterium]
MRTIRALAQAGLVVSLLAGCGGGASDDDASGDGTTSGDEAAATPRDACLAMMRRERSCQQDFVPALVALRVRLDQPSGIAQTDAAEGRDALVAQARAEYEADATDEAFEANCAQMDELPAERAEGWTSMMRECLAASACGAFVECDMRFVEHRFGGS